MLAADERGLALWPCSEGGHPSDDAGSIVTRADSEYVARGLACHAARANGPTQHTSTCQ